MRRSGHSLVLALLAATLPVTAGAHALHGDSDSARVTLRARAPTACSVTPTTSSLEVASNAVATDRGAVFDFHAPPASRVSVSCNMASSQISVRAEAMQLLNGRLSAASAHAGFTDMIDFAVTVTGPTAYAAAAQLGDGTSQATHPDGAVPDHIPYGAYAGDMQLEVSRIAPRDGKTPVSGSYRGLISVTVSP